MASDRRPFFTVFSIIFAHDCSTFSLRSNHPPNVPFIRTECFKSTFSPSSTLSWNQLDPNIQNSSSIQIFKRALLKFIRPKPALIYKIHHPRGLKLLTRLRRLGPNHFREHKFRHNFNDLETSEHFLLRCPIYAYLRLKLFDNLRNNNVTFTVEKSFNCSDCSVWFRKLRFDSQ